MFIQINNEPRSYAWGASDGLAEILGTAPTGKPEAELWLGSHPGSPAQIAKARPLPQSLIELIDSDLARYGVDGQHLPFLFKVLAINAPLSLQVHPTLEQARAGCADEDARGVPRDAPHRNYRDDNHKPELLVALSEVDALSGFRPWGEALADLEAILQALPADQNTQSFAAGVQLFAQGDDEAARESFVRWALQDSAEAAEAVVALGGLIEQGLGSLPLATLRVEALQRIHAHYPTDAGLLVSLLLHVVRLSSGEAIYLDAGNLHAYLRGTAVEVMAASDNVLRGGLTAKHIDVAELCRVMSFEALAEPLIQPTFPAPGIAEWNPELPDFRLFRVDVMADNGEKDDAIGQTLLRDGRFEPASQTEIATDYPVVLFVASGSINVQRTDDGIKEISRLRRGQSLYASAGEPITISGEGTAYLATVGARWGIQHA